MSIDATWPHDRQLHAWWVTAGLLAGEYPGSPVPSDATSKLALLDDAGVTLIVDLTTPADSLRPYRDQLSALGTRTGRDIARMSVPIPDRGVIDDAGYDAIVGAITHEIAAGGVVYLHCWGGVGRTSTVVACVLGDTGLDLHATLDRIEVLRAGTRKSHRGSVESRAQREFLATRFARRI